MRERQPPRLAFVVEGDLDRAVVETLARRIWGHPVHLHTVRLGGKAAVPWLWSAAMPLLDEKGYDHVIVLLDADTTSRDDIVEQEDALKAQFAQHRLREDEVSLVLAVPEIEAWLIADEDAAPEEAPREKLTRRYGHRTRELFAKRADALDLQVGRERSPSLNRFIETLEELQARFARAA